MNSEILFTSPKNVTQIFPEETIQDTDEKDMLKPKMNKKCLQVPSKKENQYFKSNKFLNSSKDQKRFSGTLLQDQISQKTNSIQGKNFVKQNTSIVPQEQVASENNKNEKIGTLEDLDKDLISPTPDTNQKIIIGNALRRLKYDDKKDSPMHLDPFMINSPKPRNSVASMNSGERTRRRISNFQKSLFQKRVKHEDEFGGGPNGLNDKDYEADKLFTNQAVTSEKNNKVSQNIPPQISGEIEADSHISSIIQKGRIFSNQRRTTEMMNSNYLSSQSKKSSSSTKRKWNFVKKLGLVRKFVEKLQAQSSVYLFSRLTKQHITMVSDKAYILKDEENVSFFSLFLRNFAQYFKNQSWLEPLSQESGILIYLNLFFLFAYTFLIYCTPLYVVFEFDNNQEEFFFGRIVPLSVHFFDIFIKCNTTYYKQGNVVTDRKRILKNYFKKNFFYDILIIIAFSYTQQPSVLHLFILIKLRELFVIEEVIHHKFFISQNIQPSYTLIKLIYVDLFLAHLFSCGFLYAAFNGPSGQQNWITQNQLDQSSWIVQYINSLYFSIITMTTVGFGDIHPYNYLEKVYVSIVTIISSGIFGYTLSVIGGIMHEKFQKEAEFKRKRYDLNHYMSMRSITKSLQMKALKYLDYVKNKEDQQPLRGQDIVYNLSEELQRQIKRDFYGSILNQYKILNFNFTPQCLADLALRMQECYYGPGEIIYSQNNLDDRIFFVAKGRVELFIETSQKQFIYEIIQKGQAFGKDQFFGQPLLTQSAKSVSFTLIVFCSQIDFKEVLMNYPEDYEKFCMMRDNLTINSKEFQTSCTVCNKLYHTISTCPLMHHMRKKEFIVHRYIHSEPMERTIKERRKYDKFNSLKEIKLVRRDLKKIRHFMIKQAKEKKLNHKINNQGSSTSSSSSSLLSSYDSDEDNDKKSRNIGNSYEKDDRQFYMKTAKIKLVDGSVQLDSAYSDFLSDSISLSEYNNYFLNLEPNDQIIKINGVETIQEEKSQQYNDDEQSYYNINRRRSNINFLQLPQSYQESPFYSDVNNQVLTLQEKIKIPLVKTGSNENVENNNNNNINKLNENTLIGSNKAAIGTNPNFDTQMNQDKIELQEQQFKEFSKKDTLAHLQNQEEEEKNIIRQDSHKEPLQNNKEDGESVPHMKHFNKQLSVKNVNNPSKFYRKEFSLRQLNGQQIPFSTFPQNSIQQSSQFSLPSINDVQSSPKQINNIDSSKTFSPQSKLNNTKSFFTSRSITSKQRIASNNNNNNNQISQIPSIPILGVGGSGSGSGETFNQIQSSKNPTFYSNQTTNTEPMPQQQSYNPSVNGSTLFGPYNFRKPFLEKPARVQMKKTSIMNDFYSGYQTELENQTQSNKFSINSLINPQIAQIQAQQQRRESYLSTNFNNTTYLNSSRRGTVGIFQVNPNMTLHMNKIQSDIPNASSNIVDPSPNSQIQKIKNIQIYSPKNSGSGQFLGNTLLIPATPISQIHRQSLKQDMSLLIKNISPTHHKGSIQQSNIPRLGSYSYENNIINSDIIFIPLEIDALREYKKYFPEGNFSFIFKEKIKIMKLLSRKFSNQTKDNPNLKKMIQKKLSKLNSISQKRSFLKQNSKFSGQSFQHTLNVPEIPRMKSVNFTPNVSINGHK
ncbi:hypothetical protein ABPG72_014048 [Tetrahymena utriculariae]